MNIWTVSLVLIIASCVSYGLAILIGWHRPTDYPSNFAVFLLLCIGALLMFAWLIVTVTAMVRGVA